MRQSGFLSSFAPSYLRVSSSSLALKYGLNAKGRREKCRANPARSALVYSRGWLIDALIPGPYHWKTVRFWMGPLSGPPAHVAECGIAKE